MGRGDGAKEELEMTQPTFNFTERKYLALVKLLDRLIEVLADGRWYQARELKTLLHTDDRTLRKLAEFSDGRVLSGNSGYKLTRCASPADMAEFEGRQLSQVAKTKERLTRTLKRWHGRAA